VLLSGYAQSNERVSELLRNVSYNSTWLQQPELLEIKAAPVGSGGKAGEGRLSEFSMRLMLKRSPSAEGTPAGAAPAPAGPRAP
jgi:type IV pilus assembly protein PilN